MEKVAGEQDLRLLSSKIFLALFWVQNSNV